MNVIIFHHTLQNCNHLLKEGGGRLGENSAVCNHGNYDTMKYERNTNKNKYKKKTNSNLSRLFWQVDPGIRSMMALQEERGSTSYSDLQKEATKKDPGQVIDSQSPVLVWSRLPGQVSFGLDGKKKSFLPSQT